MKVLLICFLFAVSIFSFGCANTNSPAVGMLWTSATGPMAVTDNEKGFKEGRATCKSYLGAVAVGDCSIHAAARAGGITFITSVDYEASNILGIIATTTTIVRVN
jgi:hypothetical protein